MIKNNLYIAASLFIFSFNSLAAANNLSTLDLNVQPGQINEKTMQPGDVSPDLSPMLPLLYSLGYLKNSDNGAYVIDQFGNQRRILNASQISAEMFNSEIAFQADIVKTENESEQLQLKSIVSLKDKISIPLFWCSSISEVLDSNISRTFFFRIDETSHQPSENGLVEKVSGEMFLWVYNHPFEVKGIERFQSQYLENGKDDNMNCIGTAGR